MFGGTVAHADLVSHAASSGLDSAHDHLNVAQGKTTAASDVAASDTGNDSPNHAAGHCLDAHCCASDFPMTTQTILRDPPTGGKLVPRATSGYVFTCTYGLLKPPRIA